MSPGFLPIFKALSLSQLTTLIQCNELFQIVSKVHFLHLFAHKPETSFENETNSFSPSECDFLLFLLPKQFNRNITMSQYFYSLDYEFIRSHYTVMKQGKLFGTEKKTSKEYEKSRFIVTRCGYEASSLNK